MLDKKVVFDVSFATFFKVIVIVIVGVFLYMVRDILLLMFISILVASAIDPWVDFFQQRKVPRWVTVLVIYVLLIGGLALLFGLLLPPLVSQVEQLVSVTPDYYGQISVVINKLLGFGVLKNIDWSDIFKSLGGKLGETAGNIYGAVTGIFGGVISVVVVFVLSFYFTVEENSFKKFIRSLSPIRHRPYVDDLVGRIQKQMGKWLRGQLILCFSVGLLTYIGLSILGVKYALVLAILAGVMEIVPYVGPVISAVPAILLALAQSPLIALLVIVVYFLVQQLENHLLVPKIMGTVLGLNPLVIILVVLVAMKLMGPVGALLAVPAATALNVFLRDVFDEREAQDKNRLQEEIHKQGARIKEEIKGEHFE